MEFFDLPQFLCITFRSLPDFSIVFAAFNRSPNLCPKSHSSAVTESNVSLCKLLIAAKMRLLRVRVSSLCKSAINRAASLSFRIKAICGSDTFRLSDFSLLITSTTALPNKARQAEIFFCFSTIQSSRFVAVSLTDTLISSLSFGGSIRTQFFGGAYSLINFSFSSFGRPFFKISSSRTAILFGIAGASTLSSATLLPITSKMSRPRSSMIDPFPCPTGSVS